MSFRLTDAAGATLDISWFRKSQLPFIANHFPCGIDAAHRFTRLAYLTFRASSRPQHVGMVALSRLTVGPAQHIVCIGTAAAEKIVCLLQRGFRRRRLPSPFGFLPLLSIPLLSRRPAALMRLAARIVICDFPERRAAPAIEEREIVWRQSKWNAQITQGILMRGPEHALCAGNVPEQFIYSETIFRRCPLLLELGGDGTKRRPPVLRGIEYGHAKLASSRCARETRKCAHRRIHFPGIDLTIDLCHPRQDAEEPAEEHVLTMPDALAYAVVLHLSFPCTVIIPSSRLP